MAKTPRGIAFDEHEPELTNEEIDPARNSGKIVLSFKGSPVLAPQNIIGFIAGKLAVADGSFQTVLFDEFSARIFHGLIQNVNGISWKTHALMPGPQRN